MAIFTAVRNKKQTAGTMMGVLKYVTQACKTMLDDQWMVTGHNCVARASYLEMMTTKQQFRKTDGRQFYHFVQSFPAEDGLTPQQVNAIGVEFAQKQFPDFEVVVATHLDTNPRFRKGLSVWCVCKTGCNAYTKKNGREG